MDAFRGDTALREQIYELSIRCYEEKKAKIQTVDTR